MVNSWIKIFLIKNIVGQFNDNGIFLPSFASDIVYFLDKATWILSAFCQNESQAEPRGWSPSPLGNTPPEGEMHTRTRLKSRHIRNRGGCLLPFLDKHFASPIFLPLFFLSFVLFWLAGCSHTREDQPTASGLWHLYILKAPLSQNLKCSKLGLSKSVRVNLNFKS